MIFRGHCYVSFNVYLGSGVEAEGHDKPDINLPGKQPQLLQDTVSAGTDVHYIHPLPHNVNHELDFYNGILTLVRFIQRLGKITIVSKILK